MIYCGSAAEVQNLSFGKPYYEYLGSSNMVTTNFAFKLERMFPSDNNFALGGSTGAQES